MTKNKKVKKEKRVKIVDATCDTALPPYWACKTKDEAYYKGFERGRVSGFDQAHKEMKEEKERLAQNHTAATLNALNKICDSGATVIESMARALLSFNKNL